MVVRCVWLLHARLLQPQEEAPQKKTAVRQGRWIYFSAIFRKTPSRIHLQRTRHIDGPRSVQLQRAGVGKRRKARAWYLDQRGLQRAMQRTQGPFSSPRCHRHCVPCCVAARWCLGPFLTSEGSPLSKKKNFERGGLRICFNKTPKP